MAVTSIKALLFLAGGCVAAGTIAYVSGALDPLFTSPPAAIAALPEQPMQADPKDSRLPAAEPPAAAAPEKPADTGTPPAAAPETAEPTVLAPSFDIVRVEGDGSIVIAGKAMPNAKVELLIGSNVIGAAMAGADGDFAAVLEEPLKPGNYQIVLRATAPDNVVAMSVETAVVSVPETMDGQVLALVEEPGKPSQMITVPKPDAPAAAAQPAAEAPAAAALPAEPKPGEQLEAALPPEPAPAEAPAAPAPAGPRVVVQAVEIDGRKIFVAGAADPGRTVRGYANEILLGDAKASPDGRYLIEAERDLPVGDYIIRVDALEPDGEKVAARAAVPFEREPGESIAAVAPPAPEAVAPPAAAQAPAAATTPKPAPPAAETPPGAVAPTAPEAPVATAPATDAPAAAAATPAAPAAPETDADKAAVTEAPSAMAEAPAAKAPATEVPAAAVAPAAVEAPTSETPPTIAETLAPAAAPGTGDATDEAPTVTTPPAIAEAPAAETPPAMAEAPAAPAPEADASAAETSPDVAEAPASEAPAPGTDVATAPSQDDALAAPPPAGVPEVISPKLQNVGSAVIIRRGDTLWRISRRVYGRGVRYSTIYLANQTQIEDPDRIWPGQVFKVPEKSNDGAADADYSTLGNRLTTVPGEAAQ